LRALGECLWLAPGMALMGVLFIAPIVGVAWTSLSDPEFGLENYRAIFSDQLYVRVLWNSIYSALGATIGCILIGYPTAYAIFRSSGRLRQLMLGLVLFSYAVGTIPRAFSWLVVLGDRGLVNEALFTVRGSREPLHLIYNQTGVLVGMIHVMLPFVTLVMLGSMMRVGAHLVPAARTLGASPGRAFWEVFFPLTRQGVLAATMLVFVYSLGFYIVPAVLGGAAQTTIVMEIRELALGLGVWGLGAALSTVVILVSIIGAAFYVRVTGLSDVYGRD
jgi:putative spermidine/putrescine transport system permease protein